MVIFWNSLFTLFLWLKVPSISAESWSAKVPNSVVGLTGSCVVIPCTFSYPTDGKTHKQFTGIWFTENHDIIFHKETSKINQNFKDRTSLLGDLHNKNCTLKISSLHQSDTGPFMFRIEIKDFDMYTYKENKVSVTVKDAPEQPTVSVAEEATSGKPVTATCVVTHSCLSDPPRFTWSHDGNQSQAQDHSQKLTSSLTFIPSREDHNKLLNCSAEFTGGKKVTGHITLKVKYPPYNVNVVRNPSEVKEHGSLEVTCTSDSNPPANSYQWFSLNGSLLTDTQTLRLERVSRYTEAISCTAMNTEGQNSSSLQRFNVLYPPYNVNVVSKPSVKENSSVEVTCTSDSNPRAHSYQWFSLNGTQLGKEHNYTLERVSRHFEAISCTAFNTEGKNSSSPWKLNVLYPPEIKNGSSCKSEMSTVCVCIVDSNPLSEVKWFGPDSSRTFPSSSIHQNKSLTIITLEGGLGFPKTLHCYATNSEGNASKTFQVPQNGVIIYLAVAVAVIVVILMAILGCVVRRHCGCRATQQPKMSIKNEQNEMKTTPKSCLENEEEKGSDTDLYTNYPVGHPVYDNRRCDEQHLEDMEDAVYANM
ncbi:B-cell receptor CD22 [Myxocyprinus asiaticus]|uniref:B-cell receptor CD22 n=1 Tax=Myxocyprinus asiaticus TaxID=70543 RepID=UPI0022235450|nr:B-cell receptor CD22 [Myxocyprinus asiaticus]